MPLSVTAVWAGLRLASWTVRLHLIFLWTATEYAISTVCSSRASRTDSRPKPQTIGRDTATRGAFVVSRKLL